VRDAIESLADVTAGVPVVMAVNREYAEPDDVLSADDELALVPPVSGGETVLVHVRVTEDPLSVDALAGLVRNPAAGAVVVFEGITREVEALEYEAYAEMAEEKIAVILADVKERHGLTAVAAEHRVGTVPLSQPSVVVAVSAGHREEAFAGAREAIDRIKAEAPIWKKEIEGGASGWVEGTLP
jgi:molybdopterin synthase catalytic subunit